MLWCVSDRTAIPSNSLTLLRPSHAALPLTHLIACAHDDLTQPLLLPWREYQYTRQVIVVPAHLLLAEEADDLVGAAGGVGGGQEVVKEGRGVVKDGLCVEEELGEEGEVLGVELGDGQQWGWRAEGEGRDKPCAPRRRPRGWSSCSWCRSECRAVGCPCMDKLSARVHQYS